MTRSEIYDKLNRTKVYLGKYSKEVQEKLFKLGYVWSGGSTNVSYTDKPFLFIVRHDDFPEQFLFISKIENPNI